jgi:hypothetical protein
MTPQPETIEINSWDDFFEAVRYLFKSAVDARNILYPLELRDLVEKTWSEELCPALKNLQREVNAATDDDLSSVGLTGSQRQLKFTAFQLAYNRFYRGGGVSGFRNVVKWIKLIVGSLSKIIPGAELVLEGIDGYEAAVGE